MKHSAFGSIRRRGKRPGYYVRFTWQGTLVERNGGPTLPIARANLAKAHALLASGAYDLETVLAEVFGEGHGSRLTFAEAAPSYLAYAAGRKRASTLTADTRRLNGLLAAPWARKRLDTITPAHIIAWLTQRQTPRKVPLKNPKKGGPKMRTVKGASGPTLNRDLALGSALFRWAIRSGYAESNPFRKVDRFSEKGRARETYLTAEESAALVAASSPIARPLIVAALSTGMRRGELLALRWRSVDFDRGTLYVEPETEKTGKGRDIPMTADLLAELLALRANQDTLAIDRSDRVFSPVTDKLLRTAFLDAKKRCEAIPAYKKGRVTFHTLRHSFASLAAQAGVPLFDLGKILGHSSSRMTQRYAHFCPDAGREAMDRLGSALDLTPTQVSEGGKAERLLAK